jgi:hypothetical protein
MPSASAAPQQFPILEAIPAVVMHRLDTMAGEERPKLLRKILVEQDSHEASSPRCAWAKATSDSTISAVRAG